MADLKISDLTAAASATGAMQLEVNDSGTSKRITVDQIKSYILVAGVITATLLGTDAVTTVKIQNLAVTGAKIADGTITSGKLAAGVAEANLGFTPANAASVVTLAGDETITGSKRGTVVVDNDGSFDMNAGNNFKCTPTANFTLTFTNITAGQSGYILLVNTGGYTVSAAATTKENATFLTTVSTAGTYLLSYFSDGTDVYVTTSGAMV